jgi:hypothetical protein
MFDVVCHFCGESNTKKMEKIQKRALGFIYEDCNSDYDTLLLKSGLPSLKIRRLRMKAIEIFKILHRQLPAYLNDIVLISTYKAKIKINKATLKAKKSESTQHKMKHGNIKICRRHICMSCHSSY